jgi:hypothetical protein
MGRRSTIHQVLGEQKITNKQLAELQSDQRKVLELRMAQNHGNSLHNLRWRLVFQVDPYANAFAGESAKLILDWFSPIDPSRIHQLARDIYQRGTGKWFIDGPEFTKWHGKQNSALWIYGIRKLSCVNLNGILNIGYSGRRKDDLIVGCRFSTIAIWPLTCEVL